MPAKLRTFRHGVAALSEGDGIRALRFRCWSRGSQQGFTTSRHLCVYVFHVQGFASALPVCSCESFFCVEHHSRRPWGRVRPSCVPPRGWAMACLYISFRWLANHVGSVQSKRRGRLNFVYLCMECVTQWPQLYNYQHIRREDPTVTRKHQATWVHQRRAS
jgi:hypothetical protein